MISVYTYMVVARNIHHGSYEQHSILRVGPDWRWMYGDRIMALATALLQDPCPFGLPAVLTQLTHMTAAQHHEDRMSSPRKTQGPQSRADKNSMGSLGTIGSVSRFGILRVRA